MGWMRDDAGKVVSLMVGKVAAPPQFAQLEAYWQALRPPSGTLPNRADFDPRGISDLLHATMLLERIAPGQVRIRLAGMALCDLLGLDLRGMPLSSLVVPDGRAGLASALEQVFDRPAQAHLRLNGERGLMRPTFGGELLILPMLGHTGACDRALACLVTTGSMGRAPRRFDLTAVEHRTIDGLAAPARSTAPRRPAPVPTPAPEPMGMAEAPARFAPAPKGRPYLRLVKSDD